MRNVEPPPVSQPKNEWQVALPGFVALGVAGIILGLSLWLFWQLNSTPVNVAPQLLPLAAALVAASLIFIVAGLLTWFNSRHLSRIRRQAEETLRHQNEYHSALHETSLALINRLETGQLLESIVARAGALLNTPHGYIDLVTADHTALESKIVCGVYTQTIGSRLALGEGVSGQVWQTGQSLSIENYRDWPGHSTRFAQLKLQAVVGVPLKSDQRVVGVLGLARTEPGRPFTPTEIEILERFAEIAGLALENARLFSAARTELVERQRADLLSTTIYQISQAASDSKSLNELFHTVHQIVKTIMPANNFYIALYDADNDLLSFPYFVDEVDEPTPPQKLGRGLTEYVLRTGRPLFCDKAKQNELENAGEAVIVGVDSPIWLGVPLIINKKTIGVMVVQHYTDPQAYGNTDLQLLEFVSSEVARAIDRKRAEDNLQYERNFALQVMNALGQGVTVTGPSGNYEYVNQAYGQIVGYRPEEIVGHLSPQDLTFVGDHPILADARSRRKTGETNTYESRLIHRAGHLVPVLVTGAPRWQADKVIGAITVVTDLTTRKRAEEALQQSEQRFRTLAENVPGTIYQCLNDERYTMLYLNDAIQTLTGYPKEDFLENRVSFHDLHHPDDVIRIRQQDTVNRAIAQRQPFHLYYRIKHKSGQWRWVEERGTGVFADDGTLQLLEGFMSDVTERTEAEEALKLSEARFRVLAENIPGVVYQCRNDSRYSLIYINEAIEQLTGYPRALFMSGELTLMDLYHPDELASAPSPQNDQGDHLQPRPFHYIYRIHHQNGEWRWVEEWGTAVFDANNVFQFFEGFISDITESKLAEEALRQSEERFRILAENIPGVIFQCKNDDRYSFIHLNEAVEDLTGYPKEDFLEKGLSFFDLYHPDDKDWMPLPSQAAPREIWEPYHIVYRIRHRSGEWRWVEEWGTPIVDRSGRPQFLEGFMIDITERKHTEEMLARNARQMEALDHMGQAVAASLDLSIVLKKVIDEISPLLQAEGMSVLLPEGEKHLTFAAASGPAAVDLIGQRIPREAGVAGQVMQTGQSILFIGDNDLQLYRAVEDVSQYHTRSLVAVPLILTGTVIGVMEAVHSQINIFTPEDQRLLEAAANWAAIAIGNARQHERIQRRLQETETMAAISRALNETLDLPFILQLIVDSARQVIPIANRALINFFDEATQLLRPVAASGQILTSNELLFRPGQGILGRVFAAGHIINVGDITREPNFVSVPNLSDPKSLLSVPVQSARRRLGVLSVSSDELQAFSTDDERLLSNLSVQAALAIENARLFEATRHRADELNTASEILRSLNAAADVEQVFPSIATGLKSIAKCDRVSLGLYDEANEWYTIAAIDQPRPELTVGTRLKVNPEASISRDVLNGKIHYAPNLELEIDSPGIQELVQAGYRSRVNLPLKASGTVVGSLNLNWRITENYTLAPLPLLEQIADAVALAIAKNRLHAKTTEALAREEGLNRIARTISGALGLSNILDAVTQLTAELTGADAASLALLNVNQQLISAIHLYNFADFAADVPLGHGQGVAWEIIDSRKPLVLTDYATHPFALPEWVAAGAQAFLGVPIAVGQETLGVLGLFRFEAGKVFSARDVELAESIGLQAGVAIQNARLIDALSQEKRQLELLYTLSQNLTKTLDPHEVADQAIQLTIQALGLELGSINLIEPGTDRIHIFAMTGYDSEALLEVDRRAQMRIGHGLGGQVALTRQTLIAPDLANDPYWNFVPGPDDEAKSAVSAPLLVGDELIGVMILLSHKLKAFSVQQLPFLNAVASSVALALQNARRFETERGRVAALTALHETGLELSTELDLPTLLSFIVERAARLLEAPMGAFSILHPDTQILELIVSYHLPSEYIGVRLKLGEGATGITAATGKPLIIDDYAEWEHRVDVYRDAPYRAIVMVPVKWRGEVAGVISVNHTQPNQFTSEDAELITLFADQAAVAIANARQHQELQRRLQESDAIARISRALNETLDLQRLLTLIVEAANRILPKVQRAVIHLLDKDGQSLQPAAVSGEGESAQTVIMRPGEGVAGQVIAQGIVINVADTLNDPRYLTPDRGSRTRSMLVAPIQSGHHRLGTLSVNSITANAFSVEDERLLGTLGTQAALAIYNAQLFEDTRRQLDELVLLNTIALVTTEAITEDELIKRTTRLIEETFFPISVGTLLIDQTGYFLIAHESYRQGPPGTRIRLNEGVTGRVAATGLPWLVPDVRVEPAYLQSDPNVQSELCVPLKAGNTILGVMNAESERVNAFSETDFRLFTTLAGQMATAIQKLRFFAELEHALKQEKAARAQLVQSEKLAAMGRLVASVAHELNNPLQAIQNALYLIRQEPALSSQAIEDLQVAATESDRMADLINRLRETYRPAASEEFRFESLNAIVVEVQKLIGTHLRHNNIEFKFEPDPNLPYIPAVRDQLKQVLLNLSLNAVEAMTTGGELVIRTQHDPDSNYVMLIIRDTGQGIAPDIMQNVFDPFFTTKETGTGLGLTITYDIIQRHNGRVEISSQPDHGTTFTIWLPTEPQTKNS